jgi:hypothetical protein
VNLSVEIDPCSSGVSQAFPTAAPSSELGIAAQHRSVSLSTDGLADRHLEG